MTNRVRIISIVAILLVAVGGAAIVLHERAEAPTTIPAAAQSEHIIIVSQAGTVADALLAYGLQEGITVEYTDYGSELGIFVEAIAGVPSEGEKGDAWWQFWINDTYSTVGASAAKVQPGDEILWRYTVSEQ